MRATQGRWAFVYTVAAILVLFSTATDVNAQVVWKTNLQQAARESARTNKPMLVSITAPWCTWCHKMLATTYQDRTLANRIHQNFIPVSVDAEQHPKIVEAIGVKGLPTTVVLSPDFQVLTKLTGFQTTQQLEGSLKEFYKSRPAQTKDVKRPVQPIRKKAPAARTVTRTRNTVAPPPPKTTERNPFAEFERSRQKPKSAVVSAPAPPPPVAAKSKPPQTVASANPFEEIEKSRSNQPKTNVAAPPKKRDPVQTNPFEGLDLPRKQPIKTAGVQPPSKTTRTSPNPFEKPATPRVNVATKPAAQTRTRPTLVPPKPAEKPQRLRKPPAQTASATAKRQPITRRPKPAAPKLETEKKENAFTRFVRRPVARLFGKKDAAEKPPAPKSSARSRNVAQAVNAAQPPRSRNTAPGPNPVKTVSSNNEFPWDRELAQTQPPKGTVTRPSPQRPPATGKRPAFNRTCLVSMVDERKLIRGSTKYTSVRRGKTICFASAAHKQKFDRNPDKYWPAFDGNCSVSMRDLNRSREGTPLAGAVYRQRVYFFADNAKLNKFMVKPAGYREPSK